MNHNVHLRHSNVNNGIDKSPEAQSLFFLFFNIVQASKLQRRLIPESLIFILKVDFLTGSSPCEDFNAK